MSYKSMPPINNNILITIIWFVYIDGDWIWSLLVVGCGLQILSDGVNLFLRQLFTHLEIVVFIWDNLSKLKFQNTVIINVLIIVFTHHFYLQFRVS